MRLRSSRLTLREYDETDFTALRAIHADPIVQQMRGNAVLTEQETRDEITYVLAAQDEQPRQRYQFIIEQSRTQTVIGYCRLTVTDWRVSSAEMGYFLHQQAWGQGFATEAGEALLALGFLELPLHRITAGCWSANMASARVMEKLGMRREGYLRDAQWVNGARGDTLLYALLHPEWLATSRPRIDIEAVI